MSIFAFSLIVFSAVLHASWNLLAKKAIDGNTFVLLSSLVVVPIYLPLAVYVSIYQPTQFGIAETIALIGATVLHLVYFICLQAAYKVGDYSVVYPVARGTGPLLSTILAILFLAENPSLMALAGITLIIAGVFIITGGGNVIARQNNRKAVFFGLLTGLCIASYTVWDKYAVASIKVSPVLLDYLATIGIVLLMLPYGLRNREKLVKEWQDNKRAIFGVAALSPLAYMIVLWVMITEPVYYVAPLREMSILIAAFMGARLLKEGQLLRRAIAAFVMVFGVASLALS